MKILSSDTSFLRGSCHVPAIGQRIIFVVFVVVTISFPRTSGSEIVTGQTDVDGDFWDFSEGAPVASGPGDLIVAFAHTHFEFWAPAGVLWLDMPPNEVVAAPTDEALYSEFVPVLTSGTFVARTLEGHYVKFVVTYFNMGSICIIDYWYQNDGSTDLDPTVPVAELSVGRIKARFR